MEELRPNQERAKIAVLFIWIMLSLEIVTLFFNYFELNIISKASSGEIGYSEIESFENKHTIFIVFTLIAYFISGITFIQWFRRAYYNLSLKTEINNGEGWAAGGWFTPIMNFFMPYTIMKELYVKTDNILSGQDNYQRKDYFLAYIGWWWALWLISNLYGYIINNFSEQFISGIGWRYYSYLKISDSLIGIPLALITIKVINDYASMEQYLPELVIEDEDEVFLSDHDEI